MANQATDPGTSTTLDPFVNVSCLDFLLIELVPMAYRIASELAAREEEWTRPLKPVESSAEKAQAHADARSVATGGAAGSVAGGGGVDEDEIREAVFYRLEMLGYRVGLGVTERFSATIPRPTTPLDTIKFLCKDLWQLLFRKQIDNLKTNHRGIFVLTDNSFKPLTRMSLDRHHPTPSHLPSSTSNNASQAPHATSTHLQGGLERSTAQAVAAGEAMLAQAQPFLWFPAGVLRGALASMGINATVQAETSALPGATFQIKTVGAKP